VSSAPGHEVRRFRSTTQAEGAGCRLQRRRIGVGHPPDQGPRSPRTPWLVARVQRFSARHLSQAGKVTQRNSRIEIVLTHGSTGESSVVLAPTRWLGTHVIPVGPITGWGRSLMRFSSGRPVPGEPGSYLRKGGIPAWIMSSDGTGMRPLRVPRGSGRSSPLPWRRCAPTASTGRTSSLRACVVNARSSDRIAIAEIDVLSGDTEVLLAG
jgi:hypothetical protein